MVNYDDYDSVISTAKRPPAAKAATAKAAAAGAPPKKGGKKGQPTQEGYPGGKGSKGAGKGGELDAGKGKGPPGGGGKGAGKDKDRDKGWFNEDGSRGSWKGQGKEQGGAQEEAKPKKTAVEKARDKYKPKKTAAEVEAERRERVEAAQLKAREKRLREMRKMANADARVLVSRKMRDTLRSVLGLGIDLQEQGDDELDDLTEEEERALGLLAEQGFPPTAAAAALAADREQQAAGAEEASSGLVARLRIWLCLHLDEDDLPEEFSASRGQFSVRSSAAAACSAAVIAEARGSFLLDVKGLLKEVLGGDEAAAEALFACVEVMLPVGDAESEQSDAEALENMEAVLSAEGADSCMGAIQARWQRMQEAIAAAKAAEVASSQSPAEDGAAGDQEQEEEQETWGDGVGAEDVADAKESSGARGQQASGRNWFGATGAAAAREAKGGAKRHEDWLASAAGRRMQSQRDELPSAKSKDELLKAIAASGEPGQGKKGKRPGPQVTIVQGETGCGKTTQVGQFILDSELAARVVVTQPRRVAAASVAQRVAEERGEKLGEGTVGYRVRGESKAHPERCRLLFCTLGVFIRRLVLGQGASLLGPDLCTHLVIDEVHERSCEVDFLLTLLKLRLSEFPHLRVVLMSATMDVTALGRMFVGAPVVQIPGRTFPVQEVYLDEVRRRLGDRMNDKDDREAAGDGGGGGAGGGGGGRLASLDFGLIARLVVALASGGRSFGDDSWPTKGAILVFVPGVGEIDRVISELERQQERGAQRLIRAFPLHGALPPEKQRSCFDILPASGPRKVVVATNVAETSITLPDVTIVVDTARERRLRLEGGSLTPCLAEQLCARDALRQRCGRAGRVQAGVCFRLVAKTAYDKLPAATPPEIAAVPLESLVLQICHMGFEPRGFLAQAPTPPEAGAVAGAMEALLSLGALRPVGDSGGGAEGGIEVTALGEHLARLPCDVRSGKLLVLGALLGCPAAAAAVAGCLSVRSPLLRADDEQEGRRKELRNGMRPGGGKSDHCFLAHLLALWNGARGKAARRDLCQRYGLGFERMSEAESTQRQLLGELKSLGFRHGMGSDAADPSINWRLLRAAVCGAFYPFVAKIERPLPKFAEGVAGAVQLEDAARDIRYFVRELDTDGRLGRSRAFVHPSSCIFAQSSFNVPYVVFSSKQVQPPRSAEDSSRLSLSSISETSVFALLLFGGRLQLNIDHKTNESSVILDGFVRFSAGSASVGALVERLRGAVDELLRMKIEDPSLNLEANSVAQTLVELLETDGVGH